MSPTRRSVHFKKLGFLILSSSILSLPASAAPGRGLNLLDSPQSLEEAKQLAGFANAEITQQALVDSFGSEAAPFSDLGTPAFTFDQGVSALLADGESSIESETANEEAEAAGCRVDPASPAIGADVPLTYFGVPSPGTNPSLVGAVQLLTSGELNPEIRTITIPLYRGVYDPTGEDVWYIATDSTDEANAQALGLNHSAKLAFGETGRGARTARIEGDGLVIFDQGRVDFSPNRRIIPNSPTDPFPLVAADPGSVGDFNYSPLVKIENAGGHIYNLPTVGWGPSDGLLLPDGTPNRANVHDSVVSIDLQEETVTLALAAGFSFGRPVLYLSTDSNSAIAAALEGATLAPGLGDIDVGADDSLFSAVERIFITINGPRGCENPQRQGIEAAITDGAAPFNVLGGIPTLALDYSPLWDANVGVWTQEAIDAGYRSRLIDEFQILSFVEFGFLTGFDGTDYGSVGVIINCPIVHRFL